MKAAKYLLSTAATAALAASAEAQFPLQAAQGAAPPALATAPPPPLATGIAPQPALPDGPTIWSKLGISKAQLEHNRRMHCRTPYGQLMSRIRAPLTAISGGLIPPFCPLTPSLAELQDPGVIGAAAKVKQDRAGAAQRIEAIKVLSGVDCSFWPEAEETLIGALRTDRNECVRYEAALALGSGCCCTCKVIVALSHTVSCSDKDGGFMEKSARVRAAAASALERCLAMNAGPELPAVAPPPVTGPERKPEIPPEGGTPPDPNTVKFVSPATAKPNPAAAPAPAKPLTFKEYYEIVPRVPRHQILAVARRSLEIGMQIGMSVSAEVIPADYAAAGFDAPVDIRPTARKSSSLWDMLTRGTGPAESQPVMAPMPAAKTTVVATKVVPIEKVVKTPAPRPTVTPAAAAGVAKVSPQAAPKATPAPVPTPPKVVTVPAQLPPLKTEMAKPTLPPMPAPKPAAVQPASAPAPKPTFVQPAATPARPTPPPMPAAVPARPTPPPMPAAAPVRPAQPVPAVPKVETPPKVVVPPAPLPVVVPQTPPTTPTPAPAPAASPIPADPIPVNLPRSIPGYGNPYGYR
jgi:hypothetical protein